MNLVLFLANTPVLLSSVDTPVLLFLARDNQCDMREFCINLKLTRKQLCFWEMGQIFVFGRYTEQ